MNRLTPLLALALVACAAHKPIARVEEVPIGPREAHVVPLDVIATEAEFPAQFQGPMLDPSSPSSAGPYPFYVTSWCPRCKAARTFLVAKNVAFVEKDIEKDPAANEELKRKLAAVGRATGGSVPIPVFDVRGRILVGFSAESYDRALAAAAR
jgi:glutaredoxin